MSRLSSKLALAALSVLALAGCATEPIGPAIAVMPGPYKPFGVFEQDQQACKAYAYQQTAGQAEAANNRAVGTAVIGTALGAALGAAVGNGRGAGIGAAYGAAAGTAVGASNSQAEGYGLQRRYDIAYSQCMYSRGNQVPGYPAPMASVPPPPPGHG
jgi:uncharacterized protein YcfJ